MSALTLTPTHKHSPRLEAIRRQEIARQLAEECAARDARWKALLAEQQKHDYAVHSADLVGKWDDADLNIPFKRREPEMIRDVSIAARDAAAFIVFTVMLIGWVIALNGILQ